MPAPPPATRFVAAEAGFLPPGPFADMVVFSCSLPLPISEVRTVKASRVVSWRVEEGVSSSFDQVFCVSRGFVSRVCPIV
jgi:hypothetical protein